MKTFLTSAFIGILATGCTNSVINTLPPDPVNTATQETNLWLPPNLEVITLKYDAELFTRISGGESAWEGQEGRAFVIVHARHQKNGQHYLLIYEGISHNTRPSQIIKFYTKEEDL